MPADTYPALLLHTFKSSGLKKPELKFYGFLQSKQLYVMLYATKSDDKRYKGHKSVVSLEQLKALREELSKIDSNLHITLRFEGSQITLLARDLSIKYSTYLSRMAVSSDLKRETLGFWFNQGENILTMLDKALLEIEKHAKTAHLLETITLDM